MRGVFVQDKFIKLIDFSENSLYNVMKEISDYTNTYIQNIDFIKENSLELNQISYFICNKTGKRFFVEYIKHYG